MSDAEDVEAGGTDRDFGITETSYESYFEKMQGACCGVCIGFLLFFGSTGLLVWNEGRAVSRRKDLENGRQVVVDINLENFNQTTVKSGLVHATALLSTPSVLRDDIFGVSTGLSANSSIPQYEESALRLKREVQMYQWQETSTSKQVETADGGTTTKTTYTYRKVWSSRKYYSSSFKDSSHRNPVTWPFDYEEWIASKVFLGNQLQLSADVIKKFSWYEPISYVDVKSIPDATFQQKVETENSNSLYYKISTGSSSWTPQVGDMKVTWEVVKPHTISIVAELNNGKLDSFDTDRGGSILLVQTGEHSSEEMFKQADKANEQMTWFLRFVGFLSMFVSILMMLQPISTALDIIPFIGDCLGDGLEKCVFPCIALTVSLPISLFMISLAWLFYRPVIAIPLCVAAGSILCCLVIRARKPKNPESNVQQHNPDKPTYSASGGQGKPHGGASPNPGHQHDEEHGHNDLPPFSEALQHDAPAASAPFQQDEPEIALPTSYVPHVYKP